MQKDAEVTQNMIDAVGAGISTLWDNVNSGIKVLSGEREVDWQAVQDSALDLWEDLNPTAKLIRQGLSWITGVDLSFGRDERAASRAATIFDDFQHEYDNFSAGLADTVTVGLTQHIRQKMADWTGRADLTDYESDAYTIGVYTGVAVTIAIDSGLAAVPAVEAATAASTIARFSTVGSYRLMQVAGNLWNAYDAIRNDDALGAAMGLLGAVTAGFHLPSGSFNPCTASQNLAGLYKGMHTSMLLLNGVNVVKQFEEGRYIQAGIDGLMLAHSLWEMSRTCFAAGTPLLTPEGSKPIEQFQAGDLVLSRSEFDPTAPVEAKQVEEVFVRVGRILHLHVGGQVIRTTPEHPFWVYNKGWLPAGQLQVNDRLLGADARWTAVDDLHDTGEYETVYNLRVAEWHTYFVGAEKWRWNAWAHNMYGGAIDDAQRAAILNELETGRPPSETAKPGQRDPGAILYKQVRDGGRYQDLVSEIVLNENVTIHGQIAESLDQFQPHILLSEPRSSTLFADIYEGGARLQGQDSAQVPVPSSGAGKTEIARLITEQALAGNTRIALIESVMSGSTRNKFIDGFLLAHEQLAASHPDVAAQLQGEFHFLRETYGFEHDAIQEGGFEAGDVRDRAFANGQLQTYDYYTHFILGDDTRLIATGRGFAGPLYVANSSGAIVDVIGGPGQNARMAFIQRIKAG